MRHLWWQIRHGWLATPLFYMVLTVLSVLVYSALSQLPQASDPPTAGALLVSKGNLWTGLSAVWFIFAWGFGIQLLIQLSRVVRLKRRETDTATLLRSGVWASANAGFFEEIIFRVYAFLSAIVMLRVVDEWLNGFIQAGAVHVVLPLANFITLGLFQREFVLSDWAVGMGVILGSLFFRSAHIHYGPLSKANVWFIGMVMFWLMFNYGLMTAILAHFLYDSAVFFAIALTSPFQLREARA